jgi:hypothetical protein
MNRCVKPNKGIKNSTRGMSGSRIECSGQEGSLERRTERWGERRTGMASRGRSALVKAMPHSAPLMQLLGLTL